MVLRDLTKIPKVVPRPCSTEEMQREIGKISEALRDIINNVTEIQGDNNLILGVPGGGTVPMQAMFAISMGDDPEADPPTFHAPSADNGWRGFIKAMRCDDSAGSNPNPAPIWVVLPGRDDIDITLPKGNVFAYELADSGEYVIVSDYSEAAGEDVLWGLAQSDSVNTPVPKVVVRKCDDFTGANPVAPDIDIYLPPHNDSQNDVKTGDVIAYTTAKNGAYVAVSDYTRPRLAQWAVAIADADVSEVPHTVNARLCDNAAGDNPGDGIVVIIPRPEFTATYIHEDDVFSVMEADDGTWTIVSDSDAHTFYENDTLVGTQPRSNFIDTATVEWDITEDAANGEVEIKANIVPSDDAQPWIQFTITTDMSGGSATADVDDFWNGPDPGASVTVHDRNDQFRMAKAADVGAGRDGAHGLAHWDATNDDWVIVTCDSLAGWVHGKMLADMAGTPKKGSFQVDGYGGPTQDIQGPGTTIDVYGVVGLTDALRTEDYTYALLNASDGRYYAVNYRAIRWAITQGAYTPGSPNVVSVKFCDDGAGANPAGTAFDAVFSSRADTGIFLPTGSVVAIGLAPNGDWVVISDVSCATYYHEGTVIGTRPILDFRDASVTWTLTQVGNTIQVAGEAQFTHPSRLAGFVQSELLAAITTSANSSVSDFWGTEDDDDTPGSSVVVYDDDDIFPYALEDAVAISSHDIIDDKYRLLQCQQMVQRITGTIPSTDVLPCGLLTSTASFDVDVSACLGITFSPFNLMPTGTEGKITIHNQYGWSVANGVAFRAEWHQGESRWELYQVGAMRCADPEDCP